jgi:hypothetical protein
MILALLIGCLTPDAFFAERAMQICEYRAECTPDLIPEDCAMTRAEREAVYDGADLCPGGFDADKAAKCLATFDEIVCDDLDATWPDCSDPEICKHLDTGE